MVVATRTFGGVEIPDTALITKALSFAKAHSTPFAYNHVQRSWLFGFILASKISHLRFRDLEVHSVAAILHDLGWEVDGPLSSEDKRFEVDGANAAREFLRREAPDWNERRLQLVWDAIALHTTNSIAFYKEPEVAATCYGICADWRGPDGAICQGLLTWEEYNRVVEVLPRLGLMEGLKSVMCELCRRKPETTYDNIAAEWGDKYVEGYSRELTIDALESSKLDDLAPTT